MAQTNRKKTSTTKSNTNSNTKSLPEQGTSKPPRRREIMALVCLFLGVFSFIGYFDAEPVFIAFLTGFVRRLVGYGFYALPPALILCAVVLAFHKGRPVLFRTICTLLITIITGAIVHLFTSDVSYEFSFAMIGELWTNGAELKSGGVLGGAISELFYLLFGRIGTAIALICIAFLLVMVAFNATITGLIEAFSKRERREYTPEQEHGYETERSSAGAGISDLPRNRQSQSRSYRHPLIPLWKKKKIDIPLDESDRPAKPDYFDGDNKEGFFKESPRVKTPDQVLDGTAVDEPEPILPEIQKESSGNEDMPLDIPFMEGRMKRPDRVLPAIIAENTGNYVDPASISKPEQTRSQKPSSTANQRKKATPVSSIVPDLDPSYAFPPLNLLSRGEPQSKAGDNEVRLNTERLEAAFQSFGVNVNISNATRGPSVTRYEAELEAGVKLNKLTGLADDIALSLGAVGVRIAAMPNRISTVGIEVPNKNISKVHLRDVIESQQFENAKSKLTFAIGMDISGEPIVGDIPKLPHMLVAGTTGSGKSVCLNSVILSILYKATPDDVRFIMIDPKMVEFKVYNSIPHLLVPVVTDVKKAAGALQWATFEMMKRYTLFAETNARDIDGYNQVVRKSKDEERKPLPQIIVVIDELADLMMMAAKEVEESVCRVAQMGRAAGIHLIIATQSPRADVITGLMKANIPSRIAFKVSSALESRIILDPGSNADKLVGHGDMLYAPTGSAKPMRLQGTWVSDKEREKVIEYIEKSGQAQYSEEVMGEIDKAAEMKSTGEKPSGDTNGSDYDDLLPQAVDVIFETGQASVSMLQRRLKLGYSRAARIVDQLEEMGVLGPFEGSKPRNVLITKDQWRQMQYVSGNAPVDKKETETIRSVSDFNEDDYLPD